MNTSKPNVAAQMILDFEQEYDPFRIKIENISIWDLLRFNVHEEISTKYTYKSSRVKSKSNRVISNISYILQYFKDTYQLKHLGNYDIFAFTSTDRLREEKGGYYKNIYFDYLNPKLKNTLFWYSTDSNFSRINKNLNQNISNIILSISSKESKNVVLKEHSNIESLFNSFNNYLSSTYYLDSFTTPIYKWSKYLIIFFTKYYSLLRILKKHSPKLILIDGSYGKKWVIAAARIYNIPCWELQHGTIYPGHMGYTHSIYTQQKYSQNILTPDKFLTFGPYFYETLASHNIFQKDQLHSIGMPYFEEKFKQTLHSENQKSNKKLRILISSQWIMVKKLNEFLKIASDSLPNNIEIQIKPHPLESRQQINSYSNISKRIHVIDQNCSFYEALENSDIHCSVFSTTLFESIGLGKPTVILNLPGCENAIDIIKLNAAKFADSPKAFCEILNKASNEPAFLNNWKQLTEDKKELFWAPESSNNFYKLLNENITLNKTP